MPEAELEKEIERQLAVMRDGAVDFYGENELADRLRVCLKEGRPLRVKLGMDPSSPDLHLGHSVVLMKLRRFLELGHTPIFLIGDFTARIGDPTGRNKTRPALDLDAVKKNAETYVDQVAKLIDVSKVEIRFNGEWMDSLSPSDFIRLCSKVTVARMLERDDFAKRYAGEIPIFIHEFLYPFVQGYDSVALEADVELGGTDQTFNLLMGREIQKAYGQRPQAVITHPLLVGLDGSEKMSKSLGNSVGIADAPEEMYGKVMSIPDSLMSEWCRLLSAGEWNSLEELLGAESEDPMGQKHELAHAIVLRIHGSEGAEAGREHFRRVVQGKGIPTDIEEITIELPGDLHAKIVDLVFQAKMASSKSEARRLVAQGAVSVDGQRITDPVQLFEAGEYLIQVGKRRFARVRLAVP